MFFAAVAVAEMNPPQVHFDVCTSVDIIRMQQDITDTIPPNLVDIFTKYGLNDQDIGNFLLDIEHVFREIRVKEAISLDHCPVPDTTAISDNLVAKELDDVRLELSRVLKEHEAAMSSLMRKHQRDLEDLRTDQELDRMAADQQCKDCREDLDKTINYLSDCRTTHAGVQKTFVAIQEEKCNERLAQAQVSVGMRCT